ncbi:MAG: M6 family metalloprotease domain-containing protein [bacterium]|jgi:M6 family metalloprotease-like protein
MKSSPALLIPVAAIFAVPVLLPCHAFALEPPKPGMIERMKREGTYAEALENAKRLGNWEAKVPKRGALEIAALSPREIADGILANLGRSLDGKSASEIGRSTSRELSYIEYDLNHDRVVDERDLLVLGFEMPRDTAVLPSIGTVKMFCLPIEFPNYPHYFTEEQFDDVLYGDGDPGAPYIGLRQYYLEQSYGQLQITGDVFSWHMASRTRDYYHPDQNEGLPTDGERQRELIIEALTAADDAGVDFSQYDNDKDGLVDGFTILWTGPNGDWATYWWGFAMWMGGFSLDGVEFGSYSWQPERWYYFGEEPPLPEVWDPGTVIHETGHGLGLPDYYDYDDSVGERGGVGGLDMMGGWGGHCCFSKYMLGWLSPTITFTNLPGEQLDKVIANPDAVLAMPWFDGVTPWAEYFMIENRQAEGSDAGYPNSGLLIWHIDARVDEGGGTRYNNSYTDHKYIKLMEADGLDEIENGGGANAGDYYTEGTSLSPVTYPNSNDYSGAPTGITVNNISPAGAVMTADILLYPDSAPSVAITSPGPGDTVSGGEVISVDAADDDSISKVELFIDGEWTADLTSAPYNYAWNTRVEFNKSVEITARAFDGNGQSASDTIFVTVDNAGVTTLSDDFESGLFKWKILNAPREPGGQYTAWDTRTSPGDPAPLGAGNEAWVRPYGGADTWHNANKDKLRSQRVDISGFTNRIHMKFFYRSRDTFEVYATTDEGATWRLVDRVQPNWGWTLWNRTFELQGTGAYIELRYTGSVHPTADAGLGANIDDFMLREAPSDPPTAAITSHIEGDVISGDATFTADASDDNAVERVYFYLHDWLVSTDEDAPWEYTRNTLDDDNHPNIVLKVISEDNDGLPSEPASISLKWKNDRPYPIFDDLEGGTDNWGYGSDGIAPDWRPVTTDSHSAPTSFGYEAPFGQYNSEGLWYSGLTPAAGRQCVDLAGDAVDDPVLAYWFKADLPDGFGGGLYLYNTWEGYMWIGGWANDRPDWYQELFPLNNYKGYSGALCWWAWGNDQTNGIGAWLDDVEINNRSVVLKWPVVEQASMNPSGIFGKITNQYSATFSVSGLTYVERVEYRLDYAPLGREDEYDQLFQISDEPFGVTFSVGNNALPNQRAQVVVTAFNSNGDSSIPISLPFWLYNLVGDTNGDGTVGEGDLDGFSDVLFLTSADTGFNPLFDCNADGVIDERDAGQIGYRWGETL